MADIPKVDAYTPAEIAIKIEQLGVTKATLPTHRSITLSILAGAFVAMGGMFYFVATADWKGSFGVGQVWGGLVFNLGLALIALCGAELFTGNTLLSVAFTSGKISARQMFRNLASVWFFNGVGAVVILALAYAGQHYTGGNHTVAYKILSVGASKMSLSFSVIFVRGILANIFVTLAVWAYTAGKTVVDKIAAMLLPITAFVAVGLEHSIANMFFLPYAILVKLTPGAVEAANFPVEKLKYLTWGAFGQNLVASTLGNLVGGALFVGVVYWFAYLWEGHSEAAVADQRKAS